MIYIMKKGFHSSALLLLFLFLLLSSSTLSIARNIAASKEVDQFANGESQIKETEYPSDFATLLGEELCKGSGSGDEEECLIRRIISEAHLDYIYTQRHKP
ncbi:putative phytosulfokines 6 [Punica granatum]|uniref:Phytosulfokine n=1 Tax=Punica granatum TaxID=22663 RepID=A0A6P8D1N7_PUNGR|nr:putative phytosulfokines 6 [Punica granatum]